MALEKIIGSIHAHQDVDRELFSDFLPLLLPYMVKLVIAGPALVSNNRNNAAFDDAVNDAVKIIGGKAGPAFNCHLVPL